MKFWKLHGIGNDFIAIDGRMDNIKDCNYGNLAQKVCHRRFSVGADGLLVVKNSNDADIKMLYYNSDGTRASMCGNGIRCFVKFIYDNNIIRKKILNIETLDGIKKATVNNVDGKINSITINMGKGSFLSKDIPVKSQNEIFINQDITVLDKTYKMSSMLMGVHHGVVLVDDLNLNEVKKYGELIEKNEIFTNGINVNFVKIEDNKNISVYTWERGCGYTLGCGTGMSASAVICNYLKKVDNSVDVTSQGGTVKIDIKDFVYMTGPAIKICEGILEV